MSYHKKWYETDKFVKVTIILEKNVTDDFQVKISSDKLEINGEKTNIKLNLLKAINVEKSTHKIIANQIEVKLYKVVSEEWKHLEKTIEVEDKADKGFSKNWDRLGKEAEELEKKMTEEQKGEDALRSLFQKIYSDSPPEVQKAMNKSYMESAGTVLSTNWKEVGEKTVDVKPVDGTEYKTWNN